MIVVSGFLTVDLAFRAAKLGASDVVAKPVGPDPSVAIVQKALTVAASTASLPAAQ